MKHAKDTSQKHSDYPSHYKTFEPWSDNNILIGLRGEQNYESFHKTFHFLHNRISYDTS